MKAPSIINLDSLSQEKILAPERNHDGYANMMSGLGTKKDKNRYTTYTPDALLPYDVLASIYIGDGLASAIVDMFADDLTREWGTIKNDEIDKDGLGVIDTALQRLDATSAFNIAEKWARLSGGSLIIIGVIDGRSPEAPLNIKTIKSIEYLKVVDINDIDYSQCEFNTDLSSPEYGKIKQYAIRYLVGNEFISRKVHASRCIPFFGKKVPNRRLVDREHAYWGISELQGVWPYLKQYESAIGSISTVLQELVIGKFKFSDFDEMLAEDGGKRAKTRMEAIELSKSVINGVMMGTDEDYLRDQISLSGVPDTLDRYMMNLASVSRYPVTKLFGRSPAGLNSTGENDTKNYYDSVRARQNSEWPYIQMLVNMVASWKKISVYTPFVWNPLFQLDEDGRAEVKRKEAEAFRTEADGFNLYITQGVLLPEQVYAEKFEMDYGPRDPESFEMEPTTTSGVAPVSGVMKEDRFDLFE